MPLTEPEMRLIKVSVTWLGSEKKKEENHEINLLVIRQPDSKLSQVPPLHYTCNFIPGAIQLPVGIDPVNTEASGNLRVSILVIKDLN